MAIAYTPTRDVTSWGGVVRPPQNIAVPGFRDELATAMSTAPGGTTLAVGQRRSYGDTLFNSAGGLVDMRGLDRLMAFDPHGGTLRAEAGITLGDIMRHIVPRGFFIKVAPGTRHVTLGGAIANDVHGKNHHRSGTFGNHVTRLELVRSDRTLTISPEIEPDLFAATLGGLGLTGIISWAEIRLQRIRSAFLEVESLAFTSLGELWDMTDRSVETHEHTVAWINGTDRFREQVRGVFFRGNWSDEGALQTHDDERTHRIAGLVPAGVLNRHTAGVFNWAYGAHKLRTAGRSRQHYGPFFHPLDAIGNWNRAYGPSGFYQYQCAVPKASMKDAVAQLLAESRRGQAPFLTVFKTFGAAASPGLLSFPMEGATLALDFSNGGEDTLRVMQRLDAIVREAGGRLYAAKDGRIPKDMWRVCYPSLERFIPFVDPCMSSDFWRRVAP